MRPWPTLLRSRVIPLALVVLATGLAALWTFLVIKTEYNRHILENAHMLARRVELRVGFAADSYVGSHQARDALRTELASDPTVDMAVFCDLSRTPHYIAGWTRDSATPVPHWSDQDIANLAEGIVPAVQKSGDDARSIPWRRPGSPQPVGFTYLEFSRDQLNHDFWETDGQLLRRVIGLSAAGIAFLSALGIVAFQAMQRAGHVEQRAEMTEQGLLAERGLTAAVLAHEIRNPLSALRFQLHSLRKNAAEPGRVTQTADMIDSELLRIQQLVSDYLEHERAHVTRAEPVDLADAAHKIETLMGELCRQSNIALIVEAFEPVIVMCDPHALRQVLMNLVINAQQAMRQAPPPPDGHAVTIRVDKADGYGTIDVSDTGPGIPPEMRERLFKPFQTSRQEGHGIGLALVKRFVDNFGGRVSVDTSAGTGTTFHLRLPLMEESTASPAADPASVLD